MESELSGEVVHAARVHETQSVSYGLGVQHTLARDWTEAAIRQGSCHHTGTFAGYLNGAQLNKQNKNLFNHRFSDISISKGSYYAFFTLSTFFSVETPKGGFLYIGN